MESEKSRSSSILKPKKTPNVLSDIDLTEPTDQDAPPAAAGRPSIRRVSFASSNFIKEFATDPEKNTIWDTTYEETVNSDSTNSSENAHNTLTVQHTQTDSMQITRESIHHANLTNNMGDKDIPSDSSLTDANRIVKKKNQQTKNLDDINIASRNKDTIPLQHVSIICENQSKLQPALATTAKTCDSTSYSFNDHDKNLINVDKENISLFTTNLRGSKVPFNQHLAGSDNILAISEENTCRSNNNRTVTDEEDMELTQESVSGKIEACGGMKSISLEDENMEFTHEIVSNKIELIKNRAIVSEASMEFTTPLTVFGPVYNEVPSNKTISSPADMHFTWAITDFGTENHQAKCNRTIMASDNMEFTQNVDLLCNSKCDRNVQETSLSDDMEFTDNIAALFNEKTNKMITSDDNMGFTQTATDSCKSKPDKSDMIDNIEFMQSNYSSTEANAVNEAKTKSRVKRTFTNKNNMEFTQSEGVLYRNNTRMNKTVVDDVDKIEFTHSVGVLSKTEPVPNDDIVEFMPNVTNFDKISKNSENVNAEFMPSSLSSCKIKSDRMEDLNMETEEHARNTALELLARNQKEIDTYSISGQDTITKNTNIQNLIEKNINVKKPFTDVSMSNLLMNTSTLKTPGSSFHSNFMPFSPCVDDTQHLINYSLSNKQQTPKSDFSKIIAGDLNPSFVNSKIMALYNFESDVFPASLETTRSNQTHLDYSESIKSRSCKETSESNKLTYIIDNKSATTELEMDSRCNELKHKPIENINTVVDCKKMLVDKEDCDLETIGNDTMITETLNISQEDITLSDSISVEGDSFIPISLAAQKVVDNITQNISIMDTTDDTEEIRKNSRLLRRKALYQARVEQTSAATKNAEEFITKMRNKLVTFKNNSKELEELYPAIIQKLNAHFENLSSKEDEASMDYSTECSLSETSIDDVVQQNRPFFQAANNCSGELEKVPTLKEKIEKKYKRSKGYWSILSMEENKYVFNVLYKSIRLEVQLNEDTGIVNNININSRIADDSEPEALLVHKISIERFSQKNIRSAIGDKYDVLSLLDYVYMNHEKMKQFLNEFDDFAKRFALKMDPEFRVTFDLILVRIKCVWNISVDMSDLDNITENSVTANAELGSVDETKIKSFVNSCPRGLSFLKSFIRCLVDYYNLLAK